MCPNHPRQSLRHSRQDEGYLLSQTTSKLHYQSAFLPTLQMCASMSGQCDQYGHRMAVEVARGSNVLSLTSLSCVADVLLVADCPYFVPSSVELPFRKILSQKRHSQLATLRRLHLTMYAPYISSLHSNLIQGAREIEGTSLTEVSLARTFDSAAVLGPWR